MKARLRKVLFACALDATAAAGCGSNSYFTDASTAEVGVPCPYGGTPVASNAVTARDFSFSPACIVISAGTTVTWTNAGMQTHTVTTEPNAPLRFDSGSLGFRGTFSFTFTSPGTINYMSLPFQVLGMQATVIVR